MKRIILARPLPEECLAVLGDEFEAVAPAELLTPEEAEKYLQDADAYMSVATAPVPRSLIEKMGERVKVVGTSSVGFDHIDVEACTKRGIAVVNTPREVILPTAELTVGLMLDVMRKISRYDRDLRQSLVCNNPPFVRENDSLSHKTVGIVGLGRIGKKVAEIVQVLGAQVIYYDKFRMKEEDEAALKCRYVPLQQLLEEADVITLHCPYTPENHHLIDKAAFDSMKPRAYLINASRGPVVDEAALIQALRAGKLAGAGLDVYEKEPLVSPQLAQMDQVVLTPHVGTLAYDVRVRMCIECLQGIMSVLRGERPYQAVNPQVLDR